MSEYEISELIAHEDDDFLIINKPAGVLSQDDQGNDVSIQALAQMHATVQLYLINRLDRPVSGLLIFKKNKENIQGLSISKRYLAIVPKGESEGQKLEHFLRRDGKQKKARISDKQFSGFKKSQLEYKRVLQLDHVDVIDVTLLTGRFHQIRAQLSHVGLPIRGDVKYGARRSNKDRSIDLHAYSISIPDYNIQLLAKSNRQSPLWTRIDEEIIINKDE